MKDLLPLLVAFVVLSSTAFSGEPVTSERAGFAVAAVCKVNTIAALRALTNPYLSERCDVSGYYAPNDGAWASYLWSSTSSATDDGGSVIRPNNIASDSRGRFLLLWDGNHANVRNWGAKGDGSTDDLAAIDAAIAALPVNSFDNPVQAPGAGKSGAYHLGTLILPQGGKFMVSDSIYISPRMEVILDGDLEFLAGAAPSASAEKFVIYTLTGSNSVGNPNTTFGVSIHGRGEVVAGSPTANPGGSGIFWQNANYGLGLRDVIVGECALRGVVASVQGGSIDGLWVVGPIWEGPGLDTQGDNEELTIGRVSIEHVNPGPSYIRGAIYHYDANGYPIPAVRLRGHNLVAGSIQTEASPLSLLVECVGCTINSIYSNELQPPAVIAKNAGLVKIQGDSIAVQILSYTSFGQPPYSILDVSRSSGVNHNVTIKGARDDGRGTYFQVATVDDFSVAKSLSSPVGPVDLVNNSGAPVALFGSVGKVAQIQLAPGNSSQYGILCQAMDQGDRVGPDGRYGLQIGSLWNGNYAVYGEWNERGLDVSGEVTAATLKTAVATLAGSTSVADWSAAGSAVLTLHANTTVGFTNSVSGQTYRMAITNTGDYTVTWPSNVKWPGGVAPAQTTGRHADVYTFIQVGAEIYGTASQNF